MKRFLSLFVLALFVSSLPATAGVTVEESQVLDRWTIRIGGFITGLDTQLRVDSRNGNRGTTINLEDDLGFDSSAGVPRLAASVILGGRHQVSLGYFSLERDSTATLTEEIEWEDLVFPVNLDARAFYETTFTELGYTYWFYSAEKTALGVVGSFVLFDLSGGISAALRVGPTFDLAADVTTSAPVVQLGFTGRHALPKRFVLNGGLGYISFSDLEGYSGDIATFSLGVEHRTWEHFGFGLGWNYTDYDIDTDDLDFLGRFAYKIDGWEIYGRVAF